MESNIIKSIESSFVFSDCINRIWTIVKDKTKIYEFCKTVNFFPRLVSLLNISSGNDKTQTSIQMTSTDLVTNNFYKSITYHITCLNITTTFKYMLYPNTLNNSTLILLNIEYMEHKSIPEYDLFNSEMTNAFLEALDAFLKTNSVYLFENQSILLNTSISKIWNCLINHANIELNSKCGPKKVSKDCLKLGEKFTYFYCDNETKYGRINKYDIDNSHNKWTLGFELYDEMYSNVHCQVTFFLLSIQDNQVFVSYRHDFKEPVEQSHLNDIAEWKKVYLNDLKTFVES